MGSPASARGAMACGLAVVTTPEVGLARTIEESGAGVIASGEPAALGGTLARLLADRRRLETMGQTGVKVAATAFGWNDIAERTERIYRECIATYSLA